MTVQVHDFVDEGLGHTSYLIDIGHGSAALVDPPRFPLEHERMAHERGLRIRWTFDTHSHADYVTGSPGVVDRAGATFVAPAASRLATRHRAVGDGDAIDLGPGLQMVAIATPGHTPDHHAFLLTEGGVPRVLFSGGSLMVGTVGRTDLGGTDCAEPLARHLFHSVRRLMELPDDLTVAPTHGAGSFCSAVGASARLTTIGAERTTELLSILDEGEFVRRLLSTYGSFPAHFHRLPELNRLGPRTFASVPTLDRLSFDEFGRIRDAGALVVDVRPIADFATGHVPGSMSIAMRSGFANWLGWLIEPQRPVLFVLDAAQDRVDVVRQCLDIGHENLAGELDGGIDAWTDAGLPVGTIRLVDPVDIAPTVIDVRQASEFAMEHVLGASNIELADVESLDLPADAVTFMCGHGERAMTAASIVAASGTATPISVLRGGPQDVGR